MAAMPLGSSYAFLTANWPDVSVLRYRLPGDPYAVLGSHNGKLGIILHPDLTPDQEAGALGAMIRVLAEHPGLGEPLQSAAS